MTGSTLVKRMFTPVSGYLCAMVFAVHAFGAPNEREAQAALNAGNYTEAIRQFTRFASQGSATAQYSLGLIFSRGYGTPENFSTAANWYKKAADQAHVEAQFDLGALYLRGEGVPQDASQAAKWWRKAASAGDAFAQRSLGDLYLKGDGVKRDLVQAYKWKMLSEPRHNAGRIPWGALGMRSLAKLLTPKQLGAGQRAVRKWIVSKKVQPTVD
ncbi:MAG: sel1 repeat family protein [Alphaproteobacteria bacterium]|nr:sel1 repeat family protein [Alphaproteobacteria bacterium]